MTIMWSTRAPMPSVVSYSAAGGAAQRAAGDAIPFSDVGNVQTIHRVRLAGLSPGTAYSYTVGDGANATSRAYSFTTPSATAYSPTIAVFGDMGISANAQATMPWLIKDAQSGAIDIIAHIGDVAYDLQTNGGLVGDEYMVQVEPVAAIIPYMLCPGNVRLLLAFCGGAALRSLTAAAPLPPPAARERE